MDQNLRMLFDRALRDEPPPAVGVAREAIAEGRRLRRRRHLLAGGAAAVVAVLATLLTLNVAGGPPAPTAMPIGTTPGCDRAGEWMSGLNVFLSHDVTDEQRAALGWMMRSDPRVREVVYESTEAAYERFRQMYQDAPDLVDAVKPDQLRDAFRVTLAEPAGWPEFREDVEDLPGVEAVVHVTCPSDPASGEGE
ncbi:permease-like cell division protein FtsX [Phytohabitans kaempferiae]|uniref:Permease-like cell division protein FtsX n=1 Tax=Phytohabitans kaempferiae TaxID=1620943 RepID=A0ABV6MIJ6_9ACTN